MAFDAFLKMQDVKGDSRSKLHPGEVEIEGFSWGVQNADGLQTQDFHLEHRLDKASPRLVGKMMQGQNLGEVWLSITQSTEKGTRDVLRFRLFDTSMTSYSIGHGNDNVPTDQFSIRYTKGEMTYITPNGNEVSTSITPSNW